jgi:hypothetical protein
MGGGQWLGSAILVKVETYSFAIRVYNTGISGSSNSRETER